MHNGDQTGD